MNQKLTLGRVLIYCVHPSDPETIRNNHVTELPAVVVRVWSDTCANIKVLTDGPSDAWKTSVLQDHVDYNQPRTPGTWRWPERV